ncbi:unnamed protein product [Closterium sp. Yama58-4]|nr:unnamed protein product [Closterium sp. Yama58-4]
MRTPKLSSPFWPGNLTHPSPATPQQPAEPPGSSRGTGGTAANASVANTTNGSSGADDAVTNATSSNANSTSGVNHGGISGSGNGTKEVLRIACIVSLEFLPVLGTALRLGVDQVNANPHLLPRHLLAMQLLDGGATPFLGQLAGLEAMKKDPLLIVGPMLSGQVALLGSSLGNAAQVSLGNTATSLGIIAAHCGANAVGTGGAARKQPWECRPAYAATDPTLTVSTERQFVMRTTHSDAAEMQAIAEATLPMLLCRSYSADATLQKLLCRCYSAEATLPMLLCRSYSADATLQKLLCRCYSAEATLPMLLCRSYSADATLQKLLCRCYSADATLPMLLCRSYSADATLQKLLCRCYSAEATLPMLLCRSYSADATLQKLLCRRYSAEATLPMLLCRSYSADATLQKHN